MHDIQTHNESASGPGHDVPAVEDFRVENSAGECQVTMTTEDGETLRYRLSPLLATKLVAGISTWSRSSKLLPRAGNA